MIDIESSASDVNSDQVPTTISTSGHTLTHGKIHGLLSRLVVVPRTGAETQPTRAYLILVRVN